MRATCSCPERWCCSRRLLDTVRGPIPVEWQVPSGWRVLTPFGAEAPGLEALLDNYLAAGTFSQVPVEVPGGLTLEVAWFGAGDVARSALPQVLPRVFSGAVGLMGGRAPVGRYVLLLRPDYPSGLMQGTPRQGSLQVHLPREVPLERAHEGALLSTLAHEYLHTLARVPPGRLPVDWKDWLAAWTQHTGSPEPVASWIRTAAPLPFLDFVHRAGGVVREQGRWIFDVGFDVRPEGLTVASLGPLVGAQGLARGDVVVSVEGRAVSSVEAFLQALDPTGKPVTIQLLREGVPRELRLHRAFWKDYAVSADGPSVLGLWARPGR